VLRAHQSRPQRQRRTVDALDPERGQADGGPDDVDDRVHRPDLVKGHRLGGDAVHSPLGLGETALAIFGRLLHPRRELAPLDHPPDVTVGAVAVGVLVRVRLLVPVVGVEHDVELHRRDRVHQPRRGAQRVAVYRQRRQLLAQVFEIQSERQQGADGHVAADAGEGIEVERAHRGASDRAPAPGGQSR
jgi:hypothetical protein